MKNILVPMDFSEEALHALEMAVKIAKKSQANIVLSHVIEMPAYFLEEVQSNSDIVELETINSSNVKDFLKRKMAAIKAQKRFEGAKIKDFIGLGNAFRYLLNQSTEEKIDLIIMGARGTTNAKEFLLGSTTQRMIRHAKCPVLTVKDSVGEKEIKKIIFATNAAPTPHYLTTQILLLSKILGAEITILSVITKDHWDLQRKVEKRIREFVNIHGITQYHFEVYADESVLEGIVHYAEDHGGDMIALMTHGVTSLSELVSGSIAEKVASHAHIPVWTCTLESGKNKRP